MKSIIAQQTVLSSPEAPDEDVVMHVYVVRRALGTPLGCAPSLVPAALYSFGAVPVARPPVACFYSLPMPMPMGGAFAHSALLVKTGSGAHHVVEYSGKDLDLPPELLMIPPLIPVLGAARSYPVQVQTLSRVVERRFETVKLTGDGKEAVWTKQMDGKAVPDRPGGRKPTVEETRDKMQELMGGMYGLGRTCHDAQEETRKWLGVW